MNKTILTAGLASDSDLLAGLKAAASNIGSVHHQQQLESQRTKDKLAQDLEPYLSKADEAARELEAIYQTYDAAIKPLTLSKPGNAPCYYRLDGSIERYNKSKLFLEQLRAARSKVALIAMKPEPHRSTEVKELIATITNNCEVPETLLQTVIPNILYQADQVARHEGRSVTVPTGYTSTEFRPDNSHPTHSIGV